MTGKPFLQHQIERITKKDTSGIAKHLRPYRFPEGDFIRDGYAPTDGCVWDFSIVKHDGRYHLIHIDGRRGASCFAPGNLIYFGHSSTADFVHWTTHETALHATPGAWDSAHIWAPYVFWDDQRGCWVMLYTGLNRFDCQQIGIAYSDDLMMWIKEPANPVFRPAYVDWIQYSLTSPSACRDPHVLLFDGEYILYASIALKDGRVGIAGTSSSDLVEWGNPWPVYLTTPATGAARQVESAGIHGDGDRWLLFYSHGEGTHVVVGNGPRDFCGGEPVLVWDTVAAVEVLVKQEKRWLVCGYRLQTYKGAYRFFLGVLDLRSLKVTEVATHAELAPFL